MSTIELPIAVDPRTLLRDLEIQRCERSLAYFIKQAWHVLEPSMEYKHNWHIDMICEHLEAIDAGVEVNGRPYNRLLINLPPGGMKSLILNVFYPSWIWGPRNKPHTRFLCAAHKIENLSARDAYKMRTLVTSDWYQSRWGHRVKIAADQRAKLNFANEATGFRIATAIGSLTGIRADYVFLDDPHSVESATSEVTLQSEVQNFLEAVPTRLNDPVKSVIVMIGQRLHEGDISGVILDDLNRKTPGAWDHIMLPMRYDPLRAHVTQLGTRDPREEEGELFFPDRYPLRVIEELESQLGPYGTAAQHQQEPAPRGGGILKREWWRLWDDDKLPPFDFVCASLDTAYTEKQENDYSAMTIWGVFTQASSVKLPPRGMIYHPGDDVDYRPYAETAPQVLMAYAWQKKLEFHDLIEEVTKWCKRFSVDTLLIEAKASGHSIAQEMRRTMGHETFGIRLIDPTKAGDKIARAYSVQHLFTGSLDKTGKHAPGMIWAPDKEWAEMVILQSEIFPKGKNDDLCFAAGTMIATKRGAIPIENVTTDDYALTPIGWRKVKAAGVTGCRPVVENRGLVGTFNHPVFTLDLQYQPLASISDMSKLVGYGLCDLMKTARLRKLFSKGLSTDEWAVSAAITSANPVPTQEDEAQKGCTSQYGKRTTVARFRKATMYTIETATCLTLSLRIWSAYRAACIGQFLRSILTANSLKPILRKPASKRLSGISQMTGANGIGASLLSPFRKLSRLLPSSRKAMTAQSLEPAFASGAVNRLSFEAVETSCAQQPVRQPNQNTLSGKVQPYTHGMQPVFNLTVEGAHCYYANGILVHNCDTVTQALRFLRDTGMLTRSPERIAEASEAMRHVNKNVQPLYSA